MGMMLAVVTTGLGLLIAGAVVLAGAWAAVAAGAALIALGVVVDWEKLA